jgi:hypothetical protein
MAPSRKRVADALEGLPSKKKSPFPVYDNDTEYHLIVRDSYWDTLVNLTRLPQVVEEMETVSAGHIQKQLFEHHGRYLPCIRNGDCKFKDVCVHVKHPKGPMVGMTYYSQKQWATSDFDSQRGLCYFCILYLVNQKYVQLQRDKQPFHKTINPFSVMTNVNGEYRQDQCLHSSDTLDGLYGCFRVFNLADYRATLLPDGTGGVEEVSNVHFFGQQTDLVSERDMSTPAIASTTHDGMKSLSTTNSPLSLGTRSKTRPTSLRQTGTDKVV